MNDNFAPSLAAMLAHEGGKVDNPRDPGGRTAFGVTQRVYNDWRQSQGLAPRDVWEIDQTEVAAIYRKRYWDACRCDDLPSGVDYCIFDFAVNSGVNRASRYLQRAMLLAEDGVIGPVTLATAARWSAPALISEVCSLRQKFLEQLPTFAAFGRGWTRRGAEVEGRAEEMTV